MSQAGSARDHARFVIFGTGPLGLAVMRGLLSGGMTPIRMVNRSGHADVPAGVEVVAADATDPVAAGRACVGAEVVFHCAIGPYGQWPKTLPPLMDGIIQAAASAGAKLIYGDNMYAYGPLDGHLTEDLPYRPVGPNATVRASLATKLIEAHAKGTVRAAIGRGSDFFGSHVHLSTVGDRVFARALAGKAVQVVGDPDMPHTYTFVDDFAAGLITLATHDVALGQAWHVPNAETTTTRRFVEAVFQQIAGVPRVQRAPRLLISMLALFDPAMRGVQEVLYQSERPWIVDHSKYARVFGGKATPTIEAITATLGWFRQAQVLTK